MLCSADAFDADKGELYGFINRSLPDVELDGYVEKLARRMAGFNKKALTLCKKNINARAGVPARADLFESNYILRTIDYWPDAIEAGKKMAENGVFSPSEVELDFPKKIVEILGEQKEK